MPRFVGSLRHKMDLRRRGREVGRDLSPNATYTKQANKNAKQRKLVILPAKPPPRKTKSVMKNPTPDAEMIADKGKQRHSSVTRRQAEHGVLDELKRVDELNFARGGYDDPSALNLKAMKNQSLQAQALLEGEPERTFATSMHERDRALFMSKNLEKRKPIFKNYIQNNAYILRKEAQTKKMH